MVKLNDVSISNITREDIQFPVTVSLPNFEHAVIHDIETLNQLILILEEFKQLHEADNGI
jgi:hypothetical protein